MAKHARPEARIFSVDTRFQTMARRPGGVLREKAIELAQAKIDEIQPEFDGWLERELQDLAKLIAKAAAGKAEQNWITAANFRSRQLRDIGATMRCELLSFVADSLCDLFDSIAAGAECNMDSVVCHVDALMLSRQETYRHLQPEQVPELIKGLRLVAKRASL